MLKAVHYYQTVLTETYHEKFGKLVAGLISKYEYLTRPCILAEQLMETHAGLTIHTVEVCVQNGKLSRQSQTYRKALKR